MLRFEYIVILENGFTPVLQNEIETEVRFVIEAKNRVTADRMVTAMLKDNYNVKSWSGICID